MSERHRSEGPLPSPATTVKLERKLHTHQRLVSKPSVLGLNQVFNCWWW